MIDQDKSKQELLEELAEMRRREAQWRSVVTNMPAFVTVVDQGTISTSIAPPAALIQKMRVARVPTIS